MRSRARCPFCRNKKLERWGTRGARCSRCGVSWEKGETRKETMRQKADRVEWRTLEVPRGCMLVLADWSWEDFET